MVGSAGFEKEQDCLVNVTLKNEGGLVILITSKIKVLFEKHMRKAAAEAAEESGIENAVIEVWDFGCLDFVIRARVKTAIRRAREVK
jgi:citrate lyase subunit gamma (acyl carrier protein)